jgi:hypothetical protein
MMRIPKNGRLFGRYIRRIVSHSIVLVLSLCFYLSSTSSPAQTQVTAGAAEAKEHYQNAIAAIAKSDWKTAQTEFQQVVKLAPKNALVHYDLALAYSHTDQIKSAQAELNEAIQLGLPAERKQTAEELGQRLEVMDQTQKLEVKSWVMIIQRQGDDLVIGEEYAIENRTQPPVLYSNPNGTFEFAIPPTADLGQVSAWHSDGTFINQHVIAKGTSKYAIAFEFKPGQNGVRFSYKLSYSGGKTTLNRISPYAVGRLLIASPPKLGIAADGLSPSGTEQGFET